VPIEPTLRISSGSLAKSVGLAGEAMCRIASNAGQPARQALGEVRLDQREPRLVRQVGDVVREPVTKLSIATTSQPRAIRASTTWTARSRRRR
jgi:hypothetical protein